VAPQSRRAPPPPPTLGVGVNMTIDGANGGGGEAGDERRPSSELSPRGGEGGTASIADTRATDDNSSKGKGQWWQAGERQGGAGAGGEAMHCLTYYLMHHVCVVSNVQTKEANKLQHLLPLRKSL
jgi:hypothetical protein